MRPVLLSAAVLLPATPALAADDVPLSPIGLPFSSGTPRPVDPDHPLYHHVVLMPVEDMPTVVGASATGGIMGAAKRSSFEKALRDTLASLNMLAPTDAEGKFRLTPRWLGMDAPFKISFSSHATARLSWSLTRIDSGAQIFRRDIATSAQAKGGDGSSRAVGVGRIALMTNIASMADCIDKAAYGKAPADCAMTQRFTLHPRSTTIYSYAR